MRLKKLGLKLGLTLSLLATCLGGCAVVQTKATQAEARAEAQYPPTGQFLTVEGLRIHAHVEGRGPDLVLIHGASGNTRDFTFSLVGKLAQDYRVIAIDRPGLGWSDRLPKGQDSIRDQARVLQATAAQLGAGKPVVLGQSYGGAVALAWAVDHPQSLASLVVVSGASQPWPGGLSTYYKITSSAIGQAVAVPTLTAFVGDRRVADALVDVFAPQPVPDGYAAYIGAGLTLRRASLKANADQRRSLKAEITALQPSYPQITVPTEIIHGTEDSTVWHDIHSVPLAAQIPGARLTSLPGQGHMPHHTAEAQVISAIHRAARRAGLR